MNGGDGAYGWELLIDLANCEPGAIRDAGRLRGFVVRLCDEVLLMRRYGDPFIARFGLAGPDTAGYSAVQLIETSSVVIHCSEGREAAFIDVFSCRPYDAAAVLRFATAAFGARRADSRLLVRGGEAMEPAGMPRQAAVLGHPAPPDAPHLDERRVWR